MVKKDNLDAEVADLKKELAGTTDPSASASSEVPEENQMDEPPVADAEQSVELEDDEITISDIKKALAEHGVEIDDLKGFWAQINAELKDLPTKKPLLTALGTFLIGYLAGRMSRK